jgi:RNA polymerase subunit RPABC4/transcription elongation factor Spt4
LINIQGKQRVDKHVGQYISVTSLLGCTRQIYGERLLDFYVEPPKNWWSLRGTLLHKILENPDFGAIVDEASRYLRRLVKNGELSDSGLIEEGNRLTETLYEFYAKLPPINHIPNWQSETEYEMPVGWVCNDCSAVMFDRKPEKCPSCGGTNIEEFFLRGTLDVLRPETGELYDYKTVGDRGLGIIKDGAKKEHILQFNLYRLLVERGYPVGQKETYTPIKINKIKAFYMSMMQVVGTGGVLEEKTMYQYKSPDSHPNMIGEPEIIGRKDVLVTKRGKRKDSLNPDYFETKEKVKFRCLYAVPDVPLLDLEEMVALVRERAPLLVQAFKGGVMPPRCDDEMRAWKCDGFCPDEIHNWCNEYSVKYGEPLEVKETDGMIPVEAA